MKMNLKHPRIIDIYSSILHQSRILLSDTNSDDHATTSHGADTHSDDTHSCDGHTEDHDLEEAFEHIYFVMLFLACLWFVGKLFARCGLPSLVGEIVVGIILGPNLLGFVPYSDALIVIGEIGLVLLVLEAGIDVSIGHLKVVGYRGLSVALFGSMLPLGIGTGLAIGYGQDYQSAIAIGACLAPTSMGIALNVLRNAKVLNTPTGQLIIAAAVLDDVIALMLLSELEAMADPTWQRILLPLVISPLFIIIFGILAVKCTPWLIQKIMMKTSKHQHENVILLLLFLATFIMIPVCFYAGSSHLLGAFLAGLMFCTDHTIHEAWHNQIKRIMQWMLRIFFACTIGFAVPIKDFWSVPVITGGLLYFVAIIGKILTGIFAKPLTISEFFTIAFSMSAWGEFAFILATASYGTGTMDKDSYSSVVMAVLLSVVISPLCLRATLAIARKSKENYLSKARDAHYDFDVDDDNPNHPCYFCIHTKGKGKWGHQDKLLHCIFELNLEIIDFRAFNEAEYNYSHHLPIVQDVFYVLDNDLLLPPTKRLGKMDEKKLQTRYKEIKRRLKETMGDPHSSIDVMRWLPGVRRNDDIQSPVKASVNGGAQTQIDKKKRKKKTASYCRKEAYKQARMALDNEQARSSSYLVSGISRIRPTHDSLFRDKFTYHGGIHTEQDDLIAMAFIDTLTSLQESLSPANRSSPTGSNGDKEPLNTDELFAKINTLRNCVEHLQVFQPALSDDGRGSVRSGIGRNGTATSIPRNSTGLGGEANTILSLSNPPSIHSFMDYQPGNNRSTFDGHYNATFVPLQHPNISAESLKSANGREEKSAPNNKQVPPIGSINRTKTAEHGSIVEIEHTRSMVNTSTNGAKDQHLKPAPPGMFVSHSHGLLPSATHGLNHHSGINHHSHFNHLPRDVYPRDNFAAYHGHNHLGHHGAHHGHGGAHHGAHHVPSQTHSSDHHPLHISSTESSSDGSDDLHCDTMYGDEDEHHRPLGLYTNLDDLDEEPLEYDNEEEDVESQNGDNNNKNKNGKEIKQAQSFMVQSNSAMSKHGNNNMNDHSEEKTEKPLKRSTTWSKINTIFKHRKLSLSDEESDGNNRKKKRRKRKAKNNGYDDNISVSSNHARNISWDPEEEQDTTPVDPKMLEIPQSLIKLKNKTKNKSKNQNNGHEHQYNKLHQRENSRSKRDLHQKENSRSKRDSSRSKRDLRENGKKDKSRSKKHEHVKSGSYSSTVGHIALEDAEHETLPLKALKDHD